MAAFKFHRRRTRRWWYAGTTLVVAALFGVLYVAGASAVIGGPPVASPSSFEAGDGNMLNGVNGNSDWNCFANGKSSGFASTVNIDHTCNSNLVYANALQVTADQVTTSTCTTAPCEISWVNGQKFDTACPALAVNNNPPKDEFTHVASYNETDPTSKDLFFYGATIRPNTNGNSTGNVEFDQKAGDGTTTAGCRTAGDRLIAYDFLNGGTSLNFHVITWITNQIPGVTDKLGGNTGSGACFVKTDTDAFDTTTQTGGCWGANVITESANDRSIFEGGVNTGVGGVTGAISAADNGISGGTGTGAESVPALAFAEFGINVSAAFGTEGQCTSFAQVQWESRSSGSSFSSNPQDIETESKSVSNCGSATLATKQSTTAAVAPGTSVTDTATVTGDSTSNNPSGTVTFYLCGPLTTATGCSSSVSPRVSAGTGTLSGSGGVSTATSSAVNTSGSPLTAGIYCFEATWPGDTYYQTQGALDQTGATNECFTVSKLNSSTVTTPSTSSITLAAINGGSTVTDTAVVSPNPTDVGQITGTVNFFICGPIATGTCDGTVNAGAAVIGNPKTLGTVSPPCPTLGTHAACAVSGAVGSSVITSVGRYCFRAEYSGDTKYNSSTDSANSECFTVTDTTTSSSAQKWYPNDSASVSATGGESISGTLSIQLYSNADCGVSESGGGAVSGQSYTSGDTSGTTITVNSGTQTTYGVTTASSAGFSWKVTFTSDNTSVIASTGNCEKSTLTINN